MTILIAWAAFLAGIVIGALWKGLCEKQSSSDVSLPEGSMELHRIPLGPANWRRRPDGEERWRRSA